MIDRSKENYKHYSDCVESVASEIVQKFKGDITQEFLEKVFEFSANLTHRYTRIVLEDLNLRNRKAEDEDVDILNDMVLSSLIDLSYKVDFIPTEKQSYRISVLISRLIRKLIVKE